jgi:hypothetical protein
VPLVPALLITALTRLLVGESSTVFTPACRLASVLYLLSFAGLYTFARQVAVRPAAGGESQHANESQHASSTFGVETVRSHGSAATDSPPARACATADGTEEGGGGNGTPPTRESARKQTGSPTLLAPETARSDGAGEVGSWLRNTAYGHSEGAAQLYALFAMLQAKGGHAARKMYEAWHKPAFGGRLARRLGLSAPPTRAFAFTACLLLALVVLSNMWTTELLFYLLRSCVLGYLLWEVSLHLSATDEQLDHLSRFWGPRARTGLALRTLCTSCSIGLCGSILTLLLEPACHDQPCLLWHTNCPLPYPFSHVTIGLFSNLGQLGLMMLCTRRLAYGR